jgi:hypothetical protein
MLDARRNVICTSANIGRSLAHPPTGRGGRHAITGNTQVVPSRCECELLCSLAHGACASHSPTLIRRQLRRAKARHVARRRLVAVLHQEHSLRSVRCSARGLRASELNPLTRDSKEKPVTLGTILLIVLVLMLVGAFPSWSHSRSWGYGPSGGLGLVLVVVVVLLLMGRI